ncbi:hypothetical protein I8H84_04120 [Candidatus Saccharibacteria bacterium]|nr:hypothetical protein [Candidatus Saccharibacteria bacterium]MBH1973123.1 hypothetical protein [Candidatus Saccharibacteria bacterium]MBH1990635.1 hypothetical protein [Candidatus Saccharibacteria bacterium]OGL23871.1 MAG: hypothetical protein A2791_03120 [Candidatus Saccharibacteria bacterium RIFCSPHIGHO2_01_FULL_46_30]
MNKTYEFPPSQNHIDDQYTLFDITSVQEQTPLAQHQEEALQIVARGVRIEAQKMQPASRPSVQRRLGFNALYYPIRAK